jgi:hypothetical protein
MADPQATAPAPVPADAPPVRLSQNLISILGFLLIAVGVVLIVTFALFSALTPRSNPYLDIVGYMILPGVLIGGLTLVPLGMLFRFWRLRRKGSTQRVSYRLPALDLHDPHMRRRVLAFAAFTLFVVFPVLGFSSYEGYIYTESTQFCGQTCHSVMAPEATAHANSPHARVTCAECHIGAGADWFVKAKISGLRQVYAVWANTYSRPIPPAITELRPARDTCEECHWPAKFYGSMYKEIVHFSPDEENTRRPVRMLLKVGGADESIGRVEGIHMHMVQAGKIEYVATDSGLQTIPWVRYTPAKGEARTFRSDGQANDAPAPASSAASTAWTATTAGRTTSAHRRRLSTCTSTSTASTRRCPSSNGKRCSRCSGIVLTPRPRIPAARPAPPAPHLRTLPLHLRTLLPHLRALPRCPRTLPLWLRTLPPHLRTLPLHPRTLLLRSGLSSLRRRTPMRRRPTRGSSRR